MKNTIKGVIAIFLILISVKFIFAVSVGTGITPEIETEDFEPMVWLCDDRVVLDDNTEPGRACPVEEDPEIDVTTTLITQGDGEAKLSNEYSGDSPFSARLYAPLIVAYPPSNEGTVRMTFPDGFNLTDLDSISWTAYVAQGYAPHVDVLIDTLGDGTVNDSLVFEYAKVDPLDCDDVADYPTGYINTFGDKGIVDGDAYAWLGSGVPGPCGNAAFDANHMSLTDWKTAYPNAKIIAIDIEVDGWIEESEAFIDDIFINDELVEEFSMCHWQQSVSSYIVEGTPLIERLTNYAFEGEKIVWDVLVFDKNGIEKIEDVFVTVGDTQGAGNDMEVNCILDSLVDGPLTPRSGGSVGDGEYWEECNARIGEEYVEDFSDNTAALYKCILTIETPDSMYGEYWFTVEATDLDGLSGTMDENEYWFLNPVIGITIDGSISFTDVRPGASAYSTTLLIGNDGDEDAGVLLDMFISGTDFYDSTSSGAKCPLTNQLLLGNGDSHCDVGPDFGGTDDSTDPFCYFATNGAYSSQGDHRNGDVEDYVGVGYGIGFNNPNPFYGMYNGDEGGYEIIQSNNIMGPYFSGNLLTPGSELALTFRLNLPEPCNGDFDTGSIYFWGEAI